MDDDLAELRRLKAVAGLSLRATAALCGRSHAAVGYWLNGECSPDPAVLKRGLQAVREHAEERAERLRGCVG